MHPSRFLVAHRAGNHVDQVARARRDGAEVVEADIYLHRGRLEVRHLKTVGVLPILWDRWTLSNPFAPRLELADLLRATVPQGVHLMLDLKGRDRRLGPRVRATLDELLGADAAVTVCDRTWRHLDAFADMPRVRRVCSVGSRRSLRRVLQLRRSRPLHGISIHERLLDLETVASLRGAADMVMTWPVNSPARARQLLAWGVDGLITDHPAALIGELRRCGAEAA